MSTIPAFDAPVVHVMQEGQRYGPMTMQQVIDAVAGGQAPPDTPVWWQGAAQWARFNQIPQLAEAAGIATAAAAPPAAAPAGGQAAPASPAEAQRMAAAAGQKDSRLVVLEERFAEMVKATWALHRGMAFSTRIDDVLLGAVIAASTATGTVLIDLTSDGHDHYLRFQHSGDQSRIVIGFTHLTPGLVGGEREYASVTIGWGQKVANAGEAERIVKAERDATIDVEVKPGTVTVDVDAGYAFAEIELLWVIDHYVDDTYEVNHEALRLSLAAAVHSLRAYWYARFQPAQ